MFVTKQERGSKVRPHKGLPKCFYTLLYGDKHVTVFSVFHILSSHVRKCRVHHSIIVVLEYKKARNHKKEVICQWGKARKFEARNI